MLLLFPFLVVLGLFLPGFFIAKYLGHTFWLASGFLLSLLVLFHTVFWLGIFHIPIGLGTASPCLIAASAGAAWLARRSPLAPRTKQAPPLTTPDRIVLLTSGLVGAAVLAHAAIAPLTGPDTLFRWDFLARQMLRLGRFDFYPPLTPVDFRSYFYVDGIPPLVQFTYWWLYAAAGRHLPSLTSIAVAGQFACTLVFTYGAASALFSRRAGILAAAILSACPLFVTSTVMGQETGLTTLSIAAMIYFIVMARNAEDTAAMISAGLAAAVCALSREYGWMALIAGVIALLWRRQPLRGVAIFAGAAVAAGAPWYIRNWIVAGNPLYSLRLGGFAVNPIYDWLMRSYKATFGVAQWMSSNWSEILSFFVVVAALPIFAGIAGGFKDFRRHGYLSVIALLIVAVWIQSIGYTNGGFWYAARVLSPALAVLSIIGSGFLDQLTRRPRWYVAILALIVPGQIWAAIQGAVHPNNPAALPPSEWRQVAFRPPPVAPEEQVMDQLVKIWPPGSRVLSESSYLHAMAIDRGIDVVPVWSPEVRFLFSSPPEEAERQLRALGIGSVAYYPNSVNTRFLVAASPFYGSLSQRWRLVAQIPGVLLIYRPGGGKP
jgi:Dolichyl-phosphate-mannose-protein mannosyltransferase